MDSPARNTRSSRASGLAASRIAEPPPPSRETKSKPSAARNPPLLPTNLETILLLLFPALLLFGTFFSLLSPQTRAAPYDPIMQAHYQDVTAPSYFAQKSNVFNQLFVKRGWGWTTFAFLFFALTHPALGPQNSLALTPRRTQALVRWGLVTAWWFLVTQWFFGPPIIDRGFRWTGGRCEVAEMKVEGGAADAKEVFTAVACRAAGGRWSGGHDISGHVFLLVLGSGFLLQEVGWVALRWSRWRGDARSVRMSDGAIKGAGVEAVAVEGEGAGSDPLTIGGKVAVGIIGLSCWMLLMTAIYFHTWFEKLTGLLTATLCLYAVYILPRFVPAMRQVVGLPGI